MDDKLDGTSWTPALESASVDGRPRAALPFGECKGFPRSGPLGILSLLHGTGKNGPHASSNAVASKGEKLATMMLRKIFQQWGQAQIVDKVVRLYHFVIFISCFDFSLSSEPCRYSAGISKSICYTLCGKEQKEFLIVSQGSRRKIGQKFTPLWSQRLQVSVLEGDCFILYNRTSNGLGRRGRSGKLKLIAFPI